MEAASVSGVAMAGMAFSLLVSFGVPILLLIIVKVKTKVSLIPALTGAVVFLVFAMILEQLMHMALIGPLAPTAAFFSAVPVAMVLYGCFAAGIFEETGRLCGFRLLRKSKAFNLLPFAVMFGIGHGGAEAILLNGFSSLSNLVLSFNINAAGIDAIAGRYPAEAQELLRQQLTALTGTSSEMFFIAGCERLMAIAVQISLSVIIWMAVTHRLRLYFYPIGILLHAAVNVGPALYQIKLFTLMGAEFTILGCTVAVVLLTIFLYRKTNRKQPELLETAV